MADTLLMVDTRKGKERLIVDVRRMESAGGGSGDRHSKGCLKQDIQYAQIGYIGYWKQDTQDAFTLQDAEK